MANGVGVSQPPVVLMNTANAISQKYFEPILADQIFRPSPTWWRMTRLGKKLQGGVTYDRTWANGWGLTAYARAWWDDLPVSVGSKRPKTSLGVEAVKRF